MPPVIKVQREEIIEVSFQIARQNGLEGINARLIAQELHCSVQPIFHNFHTMDELKQVVLERIGEEYSRYILAEVPGERKYKSMGLWYIRFAREEPQLFQILFMGKYMQSSNQYMQLDQNFDYIIKVGQEATGLDYDTMKKLHLHIWIYTHGIATLQATGTCIFTDQELGQMLNVAYYGFLNEYIRGEKNEKNN